MSNIDLIIGLEAMKLTITPFLEFQGQILMVIFFEKLPLIGLNATLHANTKKREKLQKFQF